MFVPFLIAVAVLLLSWMVLIKRNADWKYRDINKLPGPPTIPILGNALYFGRNTQDFFKNQLKLVRDYGLMVRVWIGSRPTIVVSDPDKLEFFLSSTEHITKSAGYEGFRSWLGNGLVLSSGDHWRRHRKMITPSFHFKILHNSDQYIASNSRILIGKLKERIGDKSVDIFPLMNYFSLDVISETAMNTKVNAQENPNSEYVKSSKGYLEIHISRFFTAIQQTDFLFKLTSDYRLQKKYVKILQDFTNRVIKARKEERRRSKSRLGDEDDEGLGIKRRSVFIDTLLDLQEESNLLTEEEIREEVDTFMLAGRDTSSTAISFCLLELANHPEIQTRLVEESIGVMGTDKDANLKFKNLNDLKYLDLVIKESMRFRAPVPFFERQLMSDVTLDGMFIPEGTTITVIPYALHRLEQFFPNPEKFDPDRFLPENCAARHNFAYIPFSAGPRNCIGQKYAMLLVKATVIKILRNFVLTPAEPEYQPVLANTAILESVNGVKVKLSLRS